MLFNVYLRDQSTIVLRLSHWFTDVCVNFFVVVLYNCQTEKSVSCLLRANFGHTSELAQSKFNLKR